MYKARCDFLKKGAIQYGKQCCTETSGAHAKEFRPTCGANGVGQRVVGNGNTDRIGAIGSSTITGGGGHLWRLKDVLPLLKHKTITFPGDSMSDQLFMGLYFEFAAIDPEVHWVRGELARDLDKRSAIRQRSTLSNGTIPLRLFRTAEQLNVSVSHHSLHLRGMWKYGVDLGTLRNIMDAADITVLNYGLKWHREHAPKLAEAYRTVVDMIARANNQESDTATSAPPPPLQKKEKKKKTLGLIRETLHQHFPTAEGNGDYEGLTMHSNTACAAITPRDRGWRNEMLHAAARAHKGFKEEEWMLPQWALFVGRPEVHALPVDCTHFCYSPRLFDALLDPFYRAVHRRFHFQQGGS
jgi:hypothetical protein